MPTRRAILATLGAVGLGGCQIQQAEPSGQWCTEARVFDRDPVDIVVNDMTRPEESAGEAIATNVPGTVRLPIGFDYHENRDIWYDGTAYQLTQTGSYTEIRQVLILDIEWDTDVTAPTDAVVKAYDSLPEVDKKAFQKLLAAADESNSGDALTADAERVEYADGFDDSYLATVEEVWIRWDGREYRVTVRGSLDEITAEGYTYEVTVLAESQTELQENLAEEHLVEMDEATAAEREIVRTAIENGEYHDCGRQEAEEKLEKRLRIAGQITWPSPLYYVSFEGRRYAIAFRNWIAAEE